MQDVKYCRVFSYENDKEFGIGEISLNKETKDFVFNPYLQIKIDYSERLFHKTKQYFENVLGGMDLPHYESYEDKTFEEVLEIEKSCLIIVQNIIDLLQSKSWVVYRHNFFETKYCPSSHLNLTKKEFSIDIPKSDYKTLISFYNDCKAAIDSLNTEIKSLNIK